MTHRNAKQSIQICKGGQEYITLSTGEIKPIEHHTTRADDRNSLYKTFAKCRGLINANVTDVTKVRWCTLTYAENMTDTKQLCKDFEKFNKRFQYYCKSQGWTAPEYIAMMEPQGRGAWHAHLLYIWQDMKAPYIANKTFADLWGHGFVKIKKLDNVDNVGAYLTAYLGDMDITESTKKEGKCKMIETEEDGKKVSKAIIKGGRLNLYPANFNMLRYSQGCKKPEITMMSEKEVKEKVSGATKTFQKAYKLVDADSDFESIIIKEQYNRIRK